MNMQVRTVCPLLGTEMRTPRHAMKSSPYHNENTLIVIWYKYYLPGWSVGKYYTFNFSLQEMFCTVSWIIYPWSATIVIFYVQILFAQICVQISSILQHPSLMLGSWDGLGSVRNTQLEHRMPPHGHPGHCTVDWPARNWTYNKILNLGKKH